MVEIRLGNLEDNPYNPRKRFDDAAMEDLKKSIDEVGLAQPLTVRPSKGDNYEVVCGIRRLIALRDLYGGNKQIPCNVMELSDEEAKVLSLTENIARESLTPIEEGRAYADYVTIEVDGEEMSVLKHIKSNPQNLGIPSKDHPDIQEIAGKSGLKTSETTVEKRIKLLVLPEEAQKAVEDGELKLSVAEQISRLYQIPDPEYREEKMSDLATHPSYRGDEPSVGQLNKIVTKHIEDYKKEEKKAREKLTEFEEAMDVRKIELERKFEEVSEWLSDEEDVDVEDIIDEEEIEEAEYPIEVKSSNVVDKLQEEINKLGGGRFDELQDQLGEYDVAKDRLQRNLEIVKEESPERCPFCGAGVHAPKIRERIQTIETEIEGIQNEMQSIDDKQANYTNRRRELRKTLKKFQRTKENYEEKRKEVGEV